MKLIKNLGIGLALIWAVDSCIKEPSYSVVPQIELQDLYFRKGAGTGTGFDTLIFKVKFTDGDGDLGAGQEDSANADSYNPWYWAYKTSDFSLGYTVDNTYPLPAGYTWLNYKARKLPQFDTLPDINCKNWQQLFDNSSQPKVIDTIYITQNLKAFNINIDVYIKNNNGSYSPYNPEINHPFPHCNSNSFRATFPDLSSSGKKSPLDGTITFRIQSFGLYSEFQFNTLKMDVSISDRAYHLSNVVEKKDFTLQQITR